MSKSKEKDLESKIQINWIQIFFSMPRSAKKFIQVTYDFLFLYISYMFSSWLFNETDNFTTTLLFGSIYVAISLFLSRYLKIYRVVVRFSGFKLMQLILFSQIVSILILGLISLILDRIIVFESLIQLFFMSVFFIGGGRFLARKILDYSDNFGKRVLVYGTDKKALELMTSIRQEPGYDVVGFIDDSRNLKGLEMHGLPVYSDVELEEKILSKRISIVVLATDMQRIFKNQNLLNRLEMLPVEVKRASFSNEFLKQKVNDFNYLEELRVEDIVGRNSVKPNEDLLKKNIEGKVVLITGAGGSIGSELSRQVSKLSPRKIILLELNEYALFKIQEELSEHSDKVLPVLGSVFELDLLESLMSSEKIDTVYHTAAYKHVPLVEANPFVGIYNNVFGTKKILDASIQAGVRSFTLISSDKAVRPTNIMGASKRISEILCQIESSKRPGTIISSVRFGNVIDSSGSAIPKFREQIRQGGPVTVTHPEITRYFMSVDESSELVIQAASMAKGGEVFVLDMGEQVNILNLVKKMIRFSGNVIETEHNKHKNPIKIIFTGLRPGEKLYEELLISGDVENTSHPKIMKMKEPFSHSDSFENFLRELKLILKKRKISELKSFLSRSNLGYVSENYLETSKTNNISMKEFKSKSSSEDIEKQKVLDKVEALDYQVEKSSSSLSENVSAKSNPGIMYKYFTNLLHKYFLLSRGLTVGVRCAVFNENDEVLLVQHTYIEGWHLPGGGLDIGESAEEAVLREVHEETAILLQDKPKLLGVFHPKKYSKRDHVVLYSSEKFSVDEFASRSPEINNFKFFSIDSLPDDLDASSRFWLFEAFSKRGNRRANN